MAACVWEQLLYFEVCIRACHHIRPWLRRWRRKVLCQGVVLAMNFHLVLGSSRTQIFRKLVQVGRVLYVVNFVGGISSGVNDHAACVGGEAEALLLVPVVFVTLRLTLVVID